MRLVFLRRPVLASLCAVAWLSLVAPCATGQPLSASAEVARALYTLSQFASWSGPLSLSEEVAVCVLGRETLGAALDELEGRPSGGRRIVVRRFREVASARGCHVVFVGRSERIRLPEVLRELHGAGALTVGAFPDFARRGGMVRLILEEERVGLEVNRSALGAGNVRLSSRVLRLARLL